jgi:hypothetical protein
MERHTAGICPAHDQWDATQREFALHMTNDQWNATQREYALHMTNGTPHSGNVAYT